MKKFDIFLSHSANDKSWARGLARSLKKEGFTVWFDEEQITPGKVFYKVIVDGMVKSDIVVTVLDPKAVARPNVFFEAGMALGLGKKVTYIVPEVEIRSGRLPLDISRGKVLYRRSPEATARELIRAKKLKS